MAFQKAVKRKLKARVAIDGPTGSGKTYTGLKLLRALVGKKGKIAVIDTEHRTASKYLGDAIDTFDVDEFDSFELDRYIKAINAAAEAGYDGLLVDSLTHAWAGKGGALEQVDAVAMKQASQGWAGGKKDGFSAWREVTPLHNELVETLIRFPGHLVVTMRSKMAYEKEGGKVVKLGMQPIQREGMEYEFDVVCDMDVAHNLVVSKTRCKVLDGKSYKKPEGEEIAKVLKKWLDEGVDIETPAVQTPAPSPAVQDLMDDMEKKPTPEENIAKAAEALGGKVTDVKDLKPKPIDDSPETRKLAEDIAKAEQMIEKAKTKKALKEAAAVIKEMTLPENVRKALVKEYRAKEASL